MLVEHPVALARADKNLKKDIPWISVSAVGMFLGSPTDIQRIGPMSEIDIFWTSTGLGPNSERKFKSVFVLNLGFSYLTYQFSYLSLKERFSTKIVVSQVMFFT